MRFFVIICLVEFFKIEVLFVVEDSLCFFFLVVYFSKNKSPLCTLLSQKQEIDLQFNRGLVVQPFITVYGDL